MQELSIEGTMNSRSAETPRFQSLTTHVGEPERLLRFAARSTTPTDLVVTPEQLHRRNVKRALAVENQPRSSIRFVGPTQIARDLRESTGRNPEAMDRIDRIRAIETLLETKPDAFNRIEALLGTNLVAQAAEIEAIRSTIDGVTGFDENRIGTLHRLFSAYSETVQRDARDLLGGALATERILTEAVDTEVSSDALVRSAASLLHGDGNDLWAAVYPNIERVHIAGVSSVSASLMDLLGAIDSETSVDIHLYLRAGTGPRLAAQFDGQPRHATARKPIDLDPSVLTTEVITATRTQEARVALAVVDQLLSRGVSPSDILVVARDVDKYEHALKRAARQYGQPLSVWTQLQVTDTIPYGLFDTLCELLHRQDSQVSIEQLINALASEWVQPGATSWESLGYALSSLKTELTEEEALPLTTWRERLTTVETEDEASRRMNALLNWLSEQPAHPTPADVRLTFESVFEAYREVVLPTHRVRDDEALTETTETARALVRVEQLIEEVASKYDKWLAREQTEQSWEAVQYLGETIATVKPGRREHANARAIDVVDGTDTWLRQAPYVITLGLVESEWPQEPDGLLPVEVRDTILAGETEAIRTLAARERWTEDREYDHFAETVSTATEFLVCTRHQRDADGTRAYRSTFLETIDPVSIGPNATRQLLSTAQKLPPALDAAVPIQNATDGDARKGDRR